MEPSYSDKKHLFFDMDDTVTQSRGHIDQDMYDFFSTLPLDIIIVSGAATQQIRTQVGDLSLYRLGQNGNHAIHPSGTVLWEEKLSKDHATVVHAHIQSLQKLYTQEITDIQDLVEERGAQISYSLIGHHEDLEKKKACDPEQTVRKSLLARVPLSHTEIEVKIGGTTCFDYFQKGRNKGYNVRRLIDTQGWNADDCLYFGDALYPGGNDETVVGVIDTVAVRNHRHTFNLLIELFGK